MVHIFRAQQKYMLLVIRAQKVAYLEHFCLIIFCRKTALTYQSCSFSHYIQNVRQNLGIKVFHVTVPLNE